MAILTSITQRLYYYGSSSVTGFMEFFEWNPQPIFQSFMILVSMYTIYHLYTQQKLESEKEQELPKMSQPEKQVFENLTWLNHIVRWFSLTHLSQSTPFALRRWLDNVNTNLENQKSDLSIYVHGFREGTVAPWIRRIEQVETNQSAELHMKATLETSDFGFLIDVQERIGTKLMQSTYSLIVTKFQCKYDISLTRQPNNDVEIEAIAIDRRPSIKMKMKPHTQQRQVQSTVPEVISNAVADAVLATPFVFVIDENQFFAGGCSDSSASSTCSSTHQRNTSAAAAVFYDVKQDSDDVNDDRNSVADIEKEANKTEESPEEEDETLMEVSTDDATCLFVKVISIDQTSNDEFDSTSNHFFVQLNSPKQQESFSRVSDIIKFEADETSSELNIFCKGQDEQTICEGKVELKQNTQDVTVMLYGNDDHKVKGSVKLKLYHQNNKENNASEKEETKQQLKDSSVVSRDISPITKVTSSYVSSPTNRSSLPPIVISGTSDCDEKSDVHNVNKSITNSVINGLSQTESNNVESTEVTKPTSLSSKKENGISTADKNDQVKKSKKENNDGHITNGAVEPNGKTLKEVSSDTPPASINPAANQLRVQEYSSSSRYESEMNLNDNKQHQESPKKKKKMSTIKRVFSKSKKKKTGTTDADDVVSLPPSDHLSPLRSSTIGTVKKRHRSSFRSLLHLGKKK